MTTSPIALAERRKTQRHGCTLPVAWRLLGNRDLRFGEAPLKDISCDGLSLQVDQICSKNAVIIVQFAAEEPAFAEPMLLQARWCKELPPDTESDMPVYQIGCSFAQPLLDQDLQALLAAPRSTAIPSPPRKKRSAKASSDLWRIGSPSEKRSALRRGGSTVRVALYWAEKDRTLEATVVDRSLKGLGIVVNHRFTRGTLLTVQPSYVRGGSCSVEVEVRHCRQKGKQWFLGCQFLKPPLSNVLILLG
jgi:hypothetical protein